ncbi:MAG TPA: thermonuclease family protein [Thermoanaerobaculia bacterium]|nr:thermonuclease family protein [Thermoanaerobaculia bacterium]
MTDARGRLHRIRIQGIDAPEMDQPMGVDAKRYMRREVLNKEVTVEVSKRDIYGREVGMVLCDGKDVGLAEIHDGLAWFDEPYAKELREDDRSRYQAAEAIARDTRRGLWAQEHPQAPWEFRRARRTK